jgi:hypothetical protein
VTINERLVPNGPEEESALEFLKQQNRGLPALQGHGTTLPDDAAALCIGQAYYQLQFPRPERGKATVVYPIVFAPNQSGPDDTAPDDDPSKGAPRQWTRSDQSDRK